MSDKLIFNCAERMTRKSKASACFTHNGEFPREVKREIDRMKALCKKEVMKEMEEENKMSGFQKALKDILAP